MSNSIPTVPPVKIDGGKDSWKIAGSIFAVTTVLGCACKTIGDIVVSWYKTKQAKKLAEYEATTKADAYERMRKADEVLYRKKKEIDIEKQLRIKELSEQEQQVHMGTLETSAPPKTRSTEEIFSQTNDGATLDWVVDGYAMKGQITMLVSKANMGKSLLVTSIAIASANGKRPELLPPDSCASTKQPVIYYRLEPIRGELEGKYGDGNVFKDADIQWAQLEDLKAPTLDGLLDHIKGLAATLNHDVLIIIDPATKLDGYTHEKGIKGLEDAQGIARRNGVTLSFIIAAHLDETSDWTTLSSKDIKGGDKAIQQAGSVIALRNERTPGGEHRFIQCLKAPKGHPDPHPEGVLVCKRVTNKLDEKNWYLHFGYVDVKPEAEALPTKTKASKSTSTGEKYKKKGNQKLDEADIELIKQLHSEGLNPKQIAVRLNYKVCEQQVRRRIKELDAK